MKLRRYEGNPILKPKPENDWESENVFNPAVVYDKGLFHLLYRGMGRDGISRIGYAVSIDGFNFFRFDKPVITPKLILEPRGCEDPRVVKIENEFFVTYTAYSEKWMRIGLASTENFIQWERYRIEWEEMNNKDAVLFPEKIGGKYVLLHRPMRGEHMSIWIAYSDNLIDWYGQREIMAHGEEGGWESEKIGAGAQPIKTEKGWLLLYHGVDEDNVYRLGAAMLSLEDPSKLLYRHPEPILEPEMDYEIRGEVPNVVFTCGACEVYSRYYVYYGGADSVVCVATVDKEEMLGIF
ncbi:MAG TPA: glycosidase [Methanophagales archaeon]|nr:glycosidase [Methanophagales archaeon]